MNTFRKAISLGALFGVPVLLFFSGVANAEDLMDIFNRSSDILSAFFKLIKYVADLIGAILIFLGLARLFGQRSQENPRKIAAVTCMVCGALLIGLDFLPALMEMLFESADAPDFTP